MKKMDEMAVEARSMKSPSRVCTLVAAAALCGLVPLAVGAAPADQGRPAVKVVQPAPDAPPVVAVVPPDPAAPAVAVVPPPEPGAPPAIAVIPPDPNQPAAVIVPPPGAEVAIAAVRPAPTSYPPCSATITDRCIQTYEGRRHRAPARRRHRR